MNTIPESTALRFARSLAMGVILSMLLFYSMHVFGRWTVENYRPHPETTTTLLLHNTCLFFGKIHTLRPNTDISALGKGIDGTKLSGSFMNFSDGHIMGIILTSFLAGVVIFFIRNMKRVK
ncbi:MAG: hypothetical protein ABIT58_02925 [Ferruginibacter sp.]